jgi:hypothetical protein
MDFLIAKTDLASALRQMLLGQQPTSDEMVDITAHAAGSAVFVITGRSVDVPAQVAELGTASAPASVLHRLKSILKTYKEDPLRIRITPGRVRVENTAISEPRIVLRNIASRIIDVPTNARDLDLLALPFLFTTEEISDSNLTTRVLNAQQSLSDSISWAASSLASLGVTSDEVRQLVESKIRAYAATLTPNLFGKSGQE